MTVVALLHKHFLFTQSPFFKCASIITNCKFATMSKPNIAVHVTLHSPFLSQLIVSNFSSVPVAFHQFFIWIALGDLDLHFLLVLSKVSCVEEETNCMIYVTNEISTYTLQGQEIFHFCRASRPNLWPIQPPVQLVLRAFSPRV